MSPSLQTMGFFMSDINFCNTKEQLNHLGEVVTGKVDGSPTGADIDTSTLPYTGQVRKTLPALEEEYQADIDNFVQVSDQLIIDKTAELDDAVNSFIQESNQVITDKTDEFDTSIANKEAEASAAIDSYRLLSKGDYAPGILLSNKFEFIEYNGEAYFAENPPYTTTSTLPDADVNLFIGGYTTLRGAADVFSNSNLLSNHNFLIQTPDDSQPAPSATPTSYPPGFQIFSGVFANETTGISNLTYIDGRVSFSGGDLYFAVPNTGGLERLTEFAASVADFDGKPRTRGVSYALVSDEYRVTVGVDALEDAGASPTPLGSVKFEQGSVATGHEVGANSQEQSHAGEEQITGLNIWPVNSQVTAKVGDQGLVNISLLRNALTKTLYKTSEQVSGSITALDFTAETATIGGSAVTLSQWNAESLSVKNYETLDDAINDVGLIKGMALNIRERTAGNGAGNLICDVEQTSIVTPNGRDVIQSTAIPGLSFVVRPDKNGIYTLESLGFPADGTDQSDDIASYFTGLPADDRRVFSCGAGFRIQKLKAVFENAPVGIQLNLENADTAHLSDGYKVKNWGSANSSNAADDSGFMIWSGTHPSIKLHNAKIANSGAADERGFATMVYSANNWQKENDVNLGDTIALANCQWRSDPSREFYEFTINNNGTWGLSEQEGFIWQPGITTSIGDHCKQNEGSIATYKALTSGVTGSTRPTHLSGSASDGGVTWEFVALTDYTVFSVSEHARFGFNSASPSYTMTVEQDLNLSVPAGVIFRPRAIPTNSNAGTTLTLGVVNSSGVATIPPIFRSKNISDVPVMVIEQGAGPFELVRFKDDLISINYAFEYDDFTVITGGSVSCGGRSSVRILPGAIGSTITNFTDGVGDQQLQVLNTSGGDVTLDGSFTLSGGVSSVVLTNQSIITLRRIDGFTSNWVEVSRSIK